MEINLLSSLFATQGAHAKVSFAEFARLDLSPGQPKVLSCLRRKEGYLQKELAGLCHVEPATMTVLLTAMEKKGLIRKETSHVSGGKRAFRVYLTEQGRELAGKVDESIRRVQEQSFQGFSEEEQRMLILLLDRVTENLSHERSSL